MKFLKNFTLEKILFLAIIISSILGFWYFEESIFLKILVIVIALFGLTIGFIKKNNDYISSRMELIGLFTVYLCSLIFYNLLYNLNLPLYVVILLIFILVPALFYCLINIDKLDVKLDKNLLWLFGVLLALSVLEVFLSLYFWPINPESKSLFIVVTFYLIVNIIYLHIHNMLRLNRIIGFIIVSLLVFITTLLLTWFKILR